MQLPQLGALKLKLPQFSGTENAAKAATPPSPQNNQNSQVQGNLMQPHAPTSLGIGRRLDCCG